MNSTVSIITPSFNSSKFIEETINSVLNQTYSKWELIIIDDCSNDNTVNIINNFIKIDKRIKLLRLNENSGAGVARNLGIKNASGRYIAFLDSDDLWHPFKLEKQIKFMEHNDYPFSFTSYQIIDEQGFRLNKVNDALNLVTYKRALYSNPIGCLTVVYDTKFFGKRFMPTIRKRQDYALWLDLLKDSNAYGISEFLALYRIRKTSISSNKLKLIKYQWQLYYKVENFNLMKSLLYTSSSSITKVYKMIGQAF